LLLELPAAVGLVDYGQVLWPLDSVLHARIKPWENPRNQLDEELLWIRRPHQHFSGEVAGDLVHRLGIPTERRYRVDVRYDSRGFRNPLEIDAASVVVIGDSFVEAGLVEEPALVSTRLAARFGVTVANLGQGGYGPQQELVVLRRYGVRLRPKVVLWFFFEGNDLLDVKRYERSLQDRNLIVAAWRSFRTRSFT
jgi:hypothetical protein